MRLISAARHALDVVMHPQLYRIHRLFKKYTMIPPQTYVSNLVLAKRTVAVPGAIVECGTWKGGMIAGMAKVLGQSRRYWLFDSFEGLPPAESIDGLAASKWQANTAAADYHDNCTASETDALAAMTLADVPQFKIVKGWFKQTLRDTDFADGIAILRMDADWYESTIQVLHSLFPAVNIGGLILIDDYYTWEGCSKAVHDYLSMYKRPETIRQLGGVCFIRKCADGPAKATDSGIANNAESRQPDLGETSR